jgi:hypothetical protein
MDDRPTPHLTPFDLGTFKRITAARWLYYLTMNAIVTGVILATKNSGFSDYAINKPEFMRLLAALDSGKLGAAYVQTSSFGSRIEDEEIVEARWLYERIKDLPTRTGKLGEFWSLPSLSGDDPM